MAVRATDALGRYGEDVAARHLCAAGFELLERNWRCREGEIDILARDAGTLVVCEVKTRRGLEFGAPLEAVTRQTAARLRRLGLACRGQASGEHGPLRIDLIGVLLPRRGGPQVEHLRGLA